MKIVGVTACTAGIAHTYIVAQKIKDAAEQAGHEIKIETQGTIGADNVLTEAEIAAADVVIVAHDIAVELTRFAEKKLVDIPISVAMKNPKSLIATIEKRLAG
ncbi:fructose PTS transporter subunit IIB [Collinsella sp. zg1085]|uniref:PTS fructose transporter subunit IIB n=1 Tax=Collinsella sp. zg1085 TaxID=2844380 RepID=UPI001C0B96E6|nr:fructose PTS transporter subunit IIB [Collinsella sp. zg1085]QWT17420.1 fructose PTS transporter subunit IIB [Collinsella sp. zg1085]